MKSDNKSAAKPAQTIEVSNAFEVMLRKHRKGVPAHEASTALQEIISAARATDKTAEMTIKVKVKPQNDSQVILDVQVTTKLPKMSTPPGVFWVDEHNQLCTSDPNQSELNLRSVEDDNPDVPIREVVPAPTGTRG